ncbi:MULTISPECIES: hypothetical protein [Treponema]|uniref:hypothetical protein n=1 Tax=Treponema TaxID=157 RepID=UPI0002B5452C|nr:MULTISPECIES: hypothetical protein [Treponema]EMB47616.1 hypothetical protein HMPREF9729_00556 [Treponema denticola ASLM]EMD55819.1 hypothetical protein HMPREF9728_02328 [Treponema denticola US-Trep]UTD09257.1 hypothetical protein HYB91_01540 [Treponema sp. B152]
MDTITILYIDNDIDSYTSQYLRESLDIGNIEKIYSEHEFTSEETYESLIYYDEVKKADLIIIDSKLFENATVKEAKLTGEEFKLILKKVLPYKEVIVVTQNEPPKEYQVLPKYRSDKTSDRTHFFNEKWLPVIKNAIKSVLEYKNLVHKIENNKNIDKHFLENIIMTLEGSYEYDLLKSEDITKLITAFKELEAKYYE